jgi:hypothetical protein
MANRKPDPEDLKAGSPEAKAGSPEAMLTAVAGKLRERTGRTLEEWIQAIRISRVDPLDQLAVRRWLRDTHGVPQNSPTRRVRPSIKSRSIPSTRSRRRSGSSYERLMTRTVDSARRRDGVPMNE